MMRMTILLGLLAAGLVLLILNHDSGRTFGLMNDDFGRLISLGAVATMIGAGVVQSRRRFGESVRQIGIWFLIMLGLVAVWLYRSEAEDFGSRMLSALVPGRAMVITDNEGHEEVILRKVLNGHFEAQVTVNGATVRMLVDTGASVISLSYEDAETLGLSPAGLTYSQSVSTANGNARGAPVTLADVSVGPIQRNDIRAIVTEKGKLDQSLLGMSFLSTLDFVQMRSDELRLRD